MKVHQLKLVCLLLFLGNILLLNHKNVPVMLACMCIGLGHVLLLLTKKQHVVLVSVAVGLSSYLYYVAFDRYQLGLVNNVVFAIALYAVYRGSIINRVDDKKSSTLF